MQITFPWGVFGNNQSEEQGCVSEILTKYGKIMLRTGEMEMALCIAFRFGEDEFNTTFNFGWNDITHRIKTGVYKRDEESELKETYDRVKVSYPFFSYEDIELAFVKLRSAVTSGDEAARLLAGRLNNVLHRLQPDGKGEPISYQLSRNKVEYVTEEDGKAYKKLTGENDERLEFFCNQMKLFVSDGSLTNDRMMEIYRIIVNYDEQVTAILEKLQGYWDTYLAETTSTTAPVPTSPTQELKEIKNLLLQKMNEKQPEASTMQKATQSVSEGVSADDGITIKEEEIKPSEGLKELFNPKYVDYADKLLAKDIAGTPKERIIHLAGIINDWSRKKFCVEVYNHAPEWAKALKGSIKISLAERTILDYLRDSMKKK